MCIAWSCELGMCVPRMVSAKSHVTSPSSVAMARPTGRIAASVHERGPRWRVRDSAARNGAARGSSRRRSMVSADSPTAPPKKSQEKKARCGGHQYDDQKSSAAASNSTSPGGARSTNAQARPHSSRRRVTERSRGRMARDHSGAHPSCNSVARQRPTKIFISRRRRVSPEGCKKTTSLMSNQMTSHRTASSARLKSGSRRSRHAS